jgi:hypothetical protein
MHTLRVKPRSILIVLAVGVISALAATFANIYWLGRIMDEGTR